MDIELDIRWRLGRGRTFEVDPLVFALLEAIRERGSLSKAVTQVGVSYRGAWNLINEWSARLGQPLVHMERGRGASLAPLGDRLLCARARAAERAGPLFAELTEELRGELDIAQPRSGSQALNISASHCLTHDIIRAVFRERTGSELTIKNSGSAKSLTNLNDGKCDAAGFHLVDGELRGNFCRSYRNCIDPVAHSLIRVATRRQGLMVAAGNPKSVDNVEALANPEIRFVNRQPNSGTRLLLDSLLQRAGIQPAGITGYDHVEFTHSAVGALVASGSADAGLGTQAVAAGFGLDFVPLANETYYFAVNAEHPPPPVDDLISVLADESYRRAVRSLPGYDPASSGEVLAAVEVFNV
ncbi:MAG: substrate-binding domain-containing protein [Gammaproteobacteria bacterium]